MTSTIPVLDLRDYHQGGEARARFIATLGRGLEAMGFVAVTHHGIDASLLDRCYRAARDTFALPEATKRSYETPANGRQRGYTSLGIEKALGHDVPDLKEFWHVGRELPLDHTLTRSGDVPPNHFPTEVPAFGRDFGALHAAMETFANTLLDGVGHYLDLPPAYFRDMVRDGNSIIRVIHYPEVASAEPGAVRAAQHEDINLLTVLPTSTQPGLELLTHEGQWMAVQTPPDVMICDTGDMMAYLTCGRLPATTHRVVNPDRADGGRMSMPFFLHPHPDHLLTPLYDGGRPPVVTRDLLMERLRAIGVA